MTDYKLNFSDDEELFEIAAEEMVKLMPKRIGELRAALDADDLPTADRIAHTLKGNAAQFNDPEAFERARSVMQAAREGDAATANAGFAALEVSFLALQAGLTAAKPASSGQ